MKERNPLIKCKDGFTMSVQAAEYAYCLPREDNPKTPYTHVECGYPSSDPLTKELLEFAERCSDYTHTVYPYTPIEVVQAELDAHGGVVEGEMPT